MEETMQKYTCKNKRGFTLVELLVVIVIIGILFVVLISRVDFATDKAKTTGVQTDFRSFQIALKQVAIEQQELPSDKNLLVELCNKNLDPKLKFILDDGNIYSEGKDPWGTHYAVSYTLIHNTRGSVEVRSAGKDQNMYTSDDYTTRVTYSLGFEGANIVITSSFDKENNSVLDDYDVIRSLAPGLYQNDTDYRHQLYSWQELLNEGIVHVTDGVLTTNYTESNDSNGSTNALNGILVLPGDGSVTSIGFSGLRQCNLISELIIPTQIINVKEAAFYQMDGLTKTFYMGNLTQWCAMNLEHYTATPCWNNTILYLDGEMLGGDIVIPSNITKINNHSFFGAQYVTSFSFGPTLVHLGENNFWGCPNLQNVYYSGTLEQWCDLTFEYNGNPCLYSASLYINDVKMEDVTIPSSITSLKPYLFDGCVSIHTIRIHKDVTNIRTDAFCSCTNLKTIIYDGTKAEWNAIPKDDNWNAYMFKYTIKCTDGDIYTESWEG